MNNGRRVAERYHGTRDVITYTRNNKLFAAFPAAGSTFGASPDCSAVTISLQVMKSAGHKHNPLLCAPSISVAPNDSGVALTYWYQDAAVRGTSPYFIRTHPRSVAIGHVHRSRANVRRHNRSHLG